MPPMVSNSRRWLRWLTPGLYVKRWLLLLTVSILLIDLGIAYLLRGIYEQTQFPPGTGGTIRAITLQFLPREVRALLFGGLGLGLLGFSFYMLQRSILGPFIPGGDRSVADVLYSNRIMSRGPRVVAIGGGPGVGTRSRRPEK